MIKTANKAEKMQKGRIIVVDDEENIRITLKEILTDEGYNVSCASDGESALRITKSVAPDLVLLDVWIPGLDGIQTLKMLKDINPDTEVVMMSGHGAIDTAVKATKFGAFDFVEKPFSLEFILLTVAKALKSKRLRMVQAKRPSISDQAVIDRRIKGSSRQAREIRGRIEMAAKSDRSLLLSGEAGLGKKFIARLIHNLSGRREKPFIEISCSSITSDSFEDVLLGSEVGNDPSSISRLEMTNGGAMFFDSVNLAPANLRRKLISIFNKGSYKPAGSKKEIKFNIRFMASFGMNQKRTKPALSALKDAEKLLDGDIIEVTPLRERKSDIPEFVEQFVDQFCDEFGKHIESVSKDALKILVSGQWPGNVSQVRDMMGLAVMACDGPILKKEHLRLVDLEKGSASTPLDFEETTYVKLHEPPRKPKKGSRTKKTSDDYFVWQKTLKNSVVLCGQGLHSGINTGLILSPMPPQSGIVFEDISTGRRVPASLEYVKSAEYATTLSDGNVTIKTVEHIMSALHSYGISNLLIKIGDEAPIMDGSALDFCQLIENSGVEVQEAPLDEIVIDKTLSVGNSDDGPFIQVEPADKFSAHYFLDYPPPIGKQEHKYKFKSSDYYKREIAPARTFGFLSEIKKLEEAGLASGGKLSNVVLIDDEKVLNTPLRFPNEPARHKVLDLIGDLYLLGRPIKGRFTAKKSGHRQNIEMVKKILEHISARGKIEEKQRIVRR